MRYAVGCLLALALGGCTSVVEVTPPDGGSHEVSNDAPVTVLFVIDDSGSTDGEQQELAAAMAPMVDDVYARNALREEAYFPAVPVRFGVVSTSVSLTFDPGSGVETRTNYNIPGGFDCRTGYRVDNGDPYPAGQLMTALGRDATVDTAESDAADIAWALEENVSLGVCGSGQEQGLRALRLVLESHPSLVDPAQRLVLVFLTDEEDCSDSDDDLVLNSTVDRCVEEARLMDGGLLDSVEEHVQFVQSAAGHTSIVVMAGAVPDGNGTVVPSLCDDTSCEAACTYPNPRQSPCYCGAQSVNRRLHALASSFENSVFESMCEGGVTRAMAELAPMLVPLPSP